jgi:hypothetical protein
MSIICEITGCDMVKITTHFCEMKCVDWEKVPSSDSASNRRINLMPSVGGLYTARKGLETGRKREKKLT